ncbi:MAG TPA: TIR domain-containing protein [Steroidobacteraceae bacterium]|nr:TIR domain-containing protein [Steroidobacteraceae bacterium]
MKENFLGDPTRDESSVTNSGRVVFLSYASQDAPAAQKICETLRAAAIEVFLDQSELRGGDAWDQKIRREIHDCALFVPLISAHSDARHEGYFRREWKLAVDRTADMSDRLAFLVPVVIDDTSDARADVPERFRQVQWTRLPGGETPPAFVERIKRLLSPEPSREPSGIASVAARASAATATPKPVPAPWRSKAVLLATIAVVVLALGYLAVNRLVLSKHGAETAAAPGTAAQSASATAFNPPPHSIAVLPFADMSEKKDQEYFSDGLTEELLNSLSEINELQVAARTSAFSFKGKDTDIGTIARKLNVGAVLEGSVRRSAHTIRITAQLINAVTGFHLWSKTYDRDLGDVLKLQTEIATSVASALKVTLLGDVAAKVELGGTGNPAAFDAYLRAAKAVSSIRDAKDLPAAIASYTEAIRLDTHYALAFAGRSIAFSGVASEAETPAAVREGFAKAQADARQALALAPDLALAQLALAAVAENGTLDFTEASDEYERALALAPGNARILRNSGQFAAYMGHFDAGVAAVRRAIVLDPLAHQSYSAFGRTLYVARRYEEALTTFAEVISLDPTLTETYANRGFAYYGLGDLEHARASCETKRDYWGSQQCLAVIYQKLGRLTEAEAELAKMKAALGDAAAYQYATIYAEWGDRAKALEWLETAWRLRDPGLETLKTDPLMDTLRREPRFQAVMQQLKFPS